MISTSIKLDGEAEFKKQLSGVNGELKNLNSDMKLVTEQFKGQANSLDALTAKDRILTEQVEQQTEKVRALEEALGQAAEAYGENDKRVDNYHRSLNEARTQLIRMQRELQDNSKYLDEAKRSANQAATSIDGFGKEVEQADRSMGSYGDTLQGFIGDLGKLKGAIVGGAAIGAIKELGGSIMELEESTREYRSIMGTLAASGEQAGYTADETAQAYGRLQSVLGDPQVAATATANLQAIGLEQEDLMKITDLAIGAWATYGDSIPIDGLAEAINETIQAGKVTGTFADVLNWAGESEDAFNEKLAEAETKTERANIVLEALSQQGLADAADGWFAVNDAIVEANTSEETLRQAWGELGEALAPVANFLRETLAGGVEWLTEKVTEAIGVVTELRGVWERTANVLEQRGGLFGGVLSWENLGKTKAELDAEDKAAQMMAGMTGADLRERGVTSADVYGAAAAAANAADAMAARGSNAPTTVHTSIYIGAREVAEAITPALREADRSNPEVVSDAL